MTEKRFVKGYHTIRDTKENKTYDFRVDIICDLLNELDEKWIDEFNLRETLQQELQRVEEGNKQLRQQEYQKMLYEIFYWVIIFSFVTMMWITVLLALVI